MSKSKHASEVVYFIRSETGSIKIGKSKRLSQRLVTLQTAFASPLVVLGVIENYEHDLEKELHTKFAKFRLKGEWFSPDPELTAWIAANAKEIKNVRVKCQPVVDRHAQLAASRLKWLEGEYMAMRNLLSPEARQLIADVTGVDIGTIINLLRRRSASITIADFDAIALHYAEMVEASLEFIKRQAFALRAADDESDSAALEECFELINEAAEALARWKEQRKASARAAEELGRLLDEASQ